MTSWGHERKGPRTSPPRMHKDGVMRYSSGRLQSEPVVIRGRPHVRMYRWDVYSLTLDELRTLAARYLPWCSIMECSILVKLFCQIIVEGVCRDGQVTIGGFGRFTKTWHAAGLPPGETMDRPFMQRPGATEPDPEVHALAKEFARRRTFKWFPRFVAAPELNALINGLPVEAVRQSGQQRLYDHQHWRRWRDQPPEAYPWPDPPADDDTPDADLLS